MTQSQINRIDSFRPALKAIRSEYGKNVKKLSQVVNSSYRAADIILRLITKELGIVTSNRLPAQNVLLPLFKWAYLNDVSEVDDIKGTTTKQMLYWFIVASFFGLYGSYINRRIQHDLEAVAQSTKFPLKALLQNIENEKLPSAIGEKDIISKRNYYSDASRDRSYLMLLNAVLFRSKAPNWAGQIVDSKNTTVHHIFPREFLKDKVEDEDMINDLGNLTLIAPQINSEISDTPPSEYLPKYDPSYLKSHLIPGDKELWRPERYAKFLLKRTQMMWEAVNEAMKELQ
jgi:hypothetical protein